LDERRKGLLHLHISILMFAGTALFAKLVSLPALDITAWRAIITVVTLGLFFALRRKSLCFNSRRDGILMLLTGVVMAIHLISYFHAMQLAGVAIGGASLFVYPVITVFIEPFFSRTRPHLADIFCGLLMVVGVLMLVPELNLSNAVTQGVCWGVFSAFFAALRNVLQAHYLRDYRGDFSMFWQCLVIALVCLPLMSSAPAAISEHDLWLLLLLGVVFTALPHSLFANCLRYLRAKTVGLIGCLQPVYGIFLAWLVLHEDPSLMTLLGSGIIVMAAAAENYRS
jgi:drug/metabolite transporter (DMT)-like permease